MYAGLADSSPHINVGYSEARTKREFAEAIADAVGFAGAIQTLRLALPHISMGEGVRLPEWRVTVFLK